MTHSPKFLDTPVVFSLSRTKAVPIFYHYCFSNWLIILASLILFVQRECSSSKSIPQFPRPQLSSLVYYKHGWPKRRPVASSPLTVLLDGIITSKMSVFNADTFLVYCGLSCQGHKNTTKITKAAYLPLTLSKPGLGRGHLKRCNICVCLMFEFAHLLSPSPHRKDKHWILKDIWFLSKEKENKKSLTASLTSFLLDSTTASVSVNSVLIISSTLIADSNGVSSASISKEQSRTKNTVFTLSYFIRSRNMSKNTCLSEKTHVNIERFAFDLLTYWLQAYKPVKSSNLNQWIWSDYFLIISKTSKNFFFNTCICISNFRTHTSSSDTSDQKLETVLLKSS